MLSEQQQKMKPDIRFYDIPRDMRQSLISEATSARYSKFSDESTGGTFPLHFYSSRLKVFLSFRCVQQHLRV